MLLNDPVVRGFNEQMLRMGVRYSVRSRALAVPVRREFGTSKLTPPRIAGIDVHVDDAARARTRADRAACFRLPRNESLRLREVGLIACECPVHAGLHVNEEHAVVELVDDARPPVPEGEPGLVCVTDLINTRCR